jgi:hypothetical protein
MGGMSPETPTRSSPLEMILSITGDEEAFVVWLISAHPANRQAIISTTNNPLAFFMIFLSLPKRHLMAAVAFGEGWLPRWYRGWKPLPQWQHVITESVSSVVETDLK